jgi:hypothetical protein
MYELSFIGSLLHMCSKRQIGEKKEFLLRIKMPYSLHHTFISRFVRIISIS